MVGWRVASSVASSARGWAALTETDWAVKTVKLSARMLAAAKDGGLVDGWAEKKARQSAEEWVV